MPKELLLTSDVDGLGIIGDVVTVADGYARNYLLPQNLATRVTEVGIARLAEARAAREAELAQELSTARALAEKLSDVSLTITARTNEEGALYGSVGAAEIVKEAKSQGIGIRKEHVELSAPIKQVGEHDVPLHLYRDNSTGEIVKATIKVWVNEE